MKLTAVRPAPGRGFWHALALAASLLGAATSAPAKTVEFGDVVKLIESHYGVHHKSMSLAARMGMKTGRVVAEHLTHYAEYGSVRFVYFEDQDFTGGARARASFAEALRAGLRPDWQSLVEVRLERDAEQTYIYTREAGKLFRVLVVNIGRRDATVVEADVSPHKLMLLLRDPEQAGRTLSDEATTDAP